MSAVIAGQLILFLNCTPNFSVCVRYGDNVDCDSLFLRDLVPVRFNIQLCQTRGDPLQGSILFYKHHNILVIFLSCNIF